MSFTLVRLACFRLGMAPLNPMMRGQDARTALPKTDRHIRPEKCPGISGITVPYLLKSLSANYRNRCPRFSETRTLSRFMPVWAVELSALHAAITPFLFSAQYIVYMIAGTALHFVFVGRMSGKMGYLLAMALLLGFLLMWALCPRLVPIDLAWSYAFALAVFVAALRFQPRALSNPAIRLLASISYPLYVVHGVLGYVVLRILMDLGVDVGQSIAVTCLIVFPLAWTIHQFVEQPGQAVARILDAPTSQPG